MKLASIITATALIHESNAKNYTFEQGSKGVGIECIPPGDSKLGIFKKDKSILYMQTESGVTTVDATRFTVDDSSYRKAKMVLSLNDVALDDEGTYLCENDKGAAKEIVITVTVKPTVELVTEKVDIEEGTEALIARCTASNAKPQPAILWTDNTGKEYEGKQTTQTLDDSRLTTFVSELVVSGVNRKDHHQKQFTCTVKQNDEQVEQKSTESMVNVLYKPDTPSINNEDTYLEQSAVSLTCNADSNPKPTYSWKVKRGNVTDVSLLDSWTLTADKKTLTTNSIQLSDNAMELTCIATNSLETVESTKIVLNVTAKPTTAPTTLADKIGGGAGKGAIVYSTIGVICLVVLVAGFLLAKKVLCAKKAVYKTEDKDEAHENLNDDELEAGKKKEYFM